MGWLFKRRGAPSAGTPIIRGVNYWHRGIVVRVPLFLWFSRKGFYSIWYDAFTLGWHSFDVALRAEFLSSAGTLVLSLRSGWCSVEKNPIRVCWPS